MLFRSAGESCAAGLVAERGVRGLEDCADCCDDCPPSSVNILPIFVNGLCKLLNNPGTGPPFSLCSSSLPFPSLELSDFLGSNSLSGFLGDLSARDLPAMACSKEDFEGGGGGASSKDLCFSAMVFTASSTWSSNSSSVIVSDVRSRFSINWMAPESEDR